MATLATETADTNPKPNTAPATAKAATTEAQTTATATTAKTPETPTLQVPLKELKTIRVRTPEKQGEEITLSETTYNTLVNTIVLHFKTVDKLKRNGKTSTAVDTAFYEAFKKLFPEENLAEDPQKLEARAKEFLQRGGAEVRLALKLVQIELATLQAASGRMAIPAGKANYRREIGGGERELNLIVTEDGAVETSTKPAGSWLERHFKGQKVKTRSGYKIVGGKTIQTDTNPLLSRGQANFLQESGWSSGDLDAEQLIALDERMASLMAASTEIHLKTGCPLDQFSLNLVEQSPEGILRYIRHHHPRLIGETGTTGSQDLREVLGREAATIRTEIKTKVEKDLKEALTKAKTERAEATVEQQLDAKIKEIEEKAPSPQQQKVREAEIKREIKRLEEEVDLLIRQSDLASELPEAEKAKNEAQQRVTERQATLNVSGETTVNLLVWSDPNDPESWIQIQAQLDYYRGIKENIERQITRLNETFKVRYPNGLNEVEIEDTKGNKKIIRPHPSAVNLAAEIDRLEKSISEDTYQQTGKTLDTIIRELEQKLNRRKAACESNKDVLDSYWEAERNLTSKQEEKRVIDAKVGQLPNGEKTVDEIDAKIKAKQKELDNVGKPASEDFLEIQALTALKTALPSSGRFARDQRISEAKRGLLPPPEIAEDSEWGQYSPAILRCVQIIFGDEVLRPYPPETVKPLVEQIQALLMIDKYKDLWNTAIGSQTWDKIDEKVIGKIIEGMRITALGIKKS